MTPATEELVGRADTPSCHNPHPWYSKTQLGRMPSLSPTAKDLDHATSIPAFLSFTQGTGFSLLPRELMEPGTHVIPLGVQRTKQWLEQESDTHHRPYLQLSTETPAPNFSLGKEAPDGIISVFTSLQVSQGTGFCSAYLRMLKGHMIIKVSKVVDKENVDGSRTKVTCYIQREPQYNYQ